ncbi:MAG TPA: M1 family aminopeptidase [Vicinamibacterales bacterium]|nr:M1 family aminopeptidase [Vicinamibacterales bacterium]
MTRPLLLALALALASPAIAQRAPDDVELFVVRLEQLASAGDAAGIRGLRHPAAEAGDLGPFTELFVPVPARAVIKERDRTPIDGGGQRLLLEVFVEHGDEARVSTWRLDLLALGASAPASDAGAHWRIAALERLTLISGLYRLSLDATRQYEIRNLELTAPDLSIQIPSGSAFVAEVQDGPTAVVLLGRGRMRFTPPDPAERTQVRIFSGRDELDAEFDAAFIRIRPSEFPAQFHAGALVPRPTVSRRDVNRAQDVFETYVAETLHVDLTDLSRDRWSLLPSVGDLIAEIRTRRHGSLTYARAWSDAEDISVFDRRRRRNISIYASADKLAARGRFYSEDDLVDYDITDYDLEAEFAPERHWISGNARITLMVRAPALTTLTMRLAETLAVRGVYSPEYGRLLHLRIIGQNSVIVNLPGTVPRHTEIRLLVVYAGRIEPQDVDREAIQVTEREQLVIPLEPRFIYSNRSYWYPQSTVTDYATARMRITVPAEYDVVASGVPTGEPSPAPGPVDPRTRPPRVFVFTTDRPARYLSCIVSRLSAVTTARLNVPASDPVLGAAARGRTSDDLHGPAAGDGQTRTGESVELVVQANPRQTGRAREFGRRAADIIEFYASIVGEAPYPSFTLAVTESELPGGHSPAYFAVLNQTVLASPAYWRNDPVAFDNYPTFFLAHEVAHQWWGQAVGWKNYHEQWISEGFAQYFAALYAERERGPGVLLGVLKQMRRWAIQESDQGPIHLGYRLGHIRGQSRVFRALIYNKAAMVLHMLRRTVGDEAFFAGMRRFYADWRFRKAGSNDFRLAMEAASQHDLEHFFEAWVYGSSIPHLKFTWARPQPDSVFIRFEHRRDVLPVPVMVTITYVDGRTESEVIPVTERVVERTLAVSGTVRRVEANQDAGALAELDR